MWQVDESVTGSVNSLVREAGFRGSGILPRAIPRLRRGQIPEGGCLRRRKCSLAPLQAAVSDSTRVSRLAEHFADEADELGR
jgi:hypothetical protein